MRRTKAEAEQTREAILVAATEMFLDRGFTRTTFNEIARAAGVTRGAIYWHFKDKLEIFFALAEQFTLPNAEASTALRSRLEADPGLDPFDELTKAIRGELQALEDDTKRRKILTILWLRCEYVDEMLPAMERLQSADRALLEQFVAIMGRAAAQGRLAPIWTPEIAARGLFLLISGSVESWLRSHGETPLVAEMLPLVSRFLMAISASTVPNASRQE